jgi:glycosyltransferase involved in cell wall biosynthesis
LTKTRNEKTGKTRILAVVRHPVGGIRTYLKYTYGQLDRQKYAFTILTVKDTEGSLIARDLGGMDVRTIELEHKHLISSLAWRVFLLLFREKYDLLHSHGFTAGALSVLGNLLSGIPHVMTSHDVFRNDQFEGARGRLKKKVLAMLFSKIDIIQSVSRDAQENLAAFLPSLKKTKTRLVTIENGIYIPSFIREPRPKGETDLRGQLGIAPDQVLFGFLGRFMEQKGFVYLIDAVGRLSLDRDFAGRFVVASVNDGGYLKEYRTLIERKGLTQYFRFHGFVSDVRAVMSELDALVMPSLWEAYGLLAAEALVMGCPVICSDCIGLREVIRQTPAITARQASADSLADALRRFMMHADSIRGETLDFVPVARERYDVTKTVRKLDMLFTATLAGAHYSR